jgi:ABC-type nitrate/sulfonate/bicarbonate transport system permease component
VAGRTQAISPLFLPPLEAVFGALGGLVQTSEFWSAVRTTLTTIAQAYLIAFVLGVGGGYLVTRSRFFTRVLEPVISGLFAIRSRCFSAVHSSVWHRHAVEVAYGAMNASFRSR